MAQFILETDDSQGRIFIFFTRRGGKILEGLKNFRWGASHIQYAVRDASGGA